MKKLLLLCLISLVLTTVDEENKGPAANPKHNDGPALCTDYLVYNNNTETDNSYIWTDDHITDQTLLPQGVSDCVDNLLWVKTKNKYYDRCCYVRFQQEGKMHAGCIPLTEENYLDISETMRRMEDGDKTIWTSSGKNSKIYQLDCSSPYLKFLSLASILLALIF